MEKKTNQIPSLFRHPQNSVLHTEENHVNSKLLQQYLRPIHLWLTYVLVE